MNDEAPPIKRTYTIKGVDKESADDVTLSIDAETAANAKVKAELKGVIVTEVIDHSAPQTNFRPAVDPAVDADFDDAPPPPAAQAPTSPGNPPPPGADDELWLASPSQWTGSPHYAVAVILGIGAIVLAVWLQTWWPLLLSALCAAYGAHRHLLIKSIRYRMTGERISVRHGILSKSLDEVELFRVKDTRLHQSFVQRLLGLGRITLITSDATLPELHLRSIPDAERVREQIRTRVLEMRQLKGVREFDME